MSLRPSIEFGSFCSRRFSFSSLTECKPPFTAHLADLREALLGESERSQRAAFVGFVAKPFDIQRLIYIVGRAAEDPSAVQAL